MAKIHTKRKRKLRMRTHLCGKKELSPGKKKRPKTFRSEEAARKYAEEGGIQNYQLVNLRGPFSREQKIKIVSNH